VITGARVELCIPYQQRDSWQDNGERWKSHAFLMKHICSLLKVLNLVPELTVQPVRFLEGGLNIAASGCGGSIDMSPLTQRNSTEFPATQRNSTEFAPFSTLNVPLNR
jgi:hypothetical protein